VRDETTASLATGANRAEMEQTILLIESSPLNQRLVRLQAERLGYTVETVSDGQAALGLVETGKHYAFVLIDRQISQPDALALAQIIREWERVYGGRVVMIAMSARTIQSDREACLAAGMDDYINKPIQLDTLWRMLKKWSAVVNVVPRPWSASPRSDEATRGFSPMFSNLQEIAGDHAEVMLEIVGLFLNETTTRLVKIRRAVLDSDAQTLEQPLEHLRVASGYLGAQVLVQLCNALGDAVDAERHAQALALYEKMADECENVQLTLKADGNRLLFRGHYR